MRGQLLSTAQSGGETGPLGRQDPALPQVFGRYLLIQRLSRGGMGEIFLAKHGLAGFEKLAVIKKVLPHLAADAQFISRFVDEAQVAIKLQHVNVAQVFEVGRVGDEYFLALEYVEGRDVRRTLAVLNQRKQRLPVDLALFVGREMANSDCRTPSGCSLSPGLSRPVTSCRRSSAATASPAFGRLILSGAGARRTEGVMDMR